MSSSERADYVCFILEVSEIMNLFDDSLWRNGQHRKLTMKMTNYIFGVLFWKQWMCSWPPTFCRQHNTIYKLDHSLQVCAIVNVIMQLLSNYISTKSKMTFSRAFVQDAQARSLVPYIIKIQRNLNVSLPFSFQLWTPS